LADYPPITTRASIVNDARTRTVSKEASFMTPSASYPALTLSDSIVRHQSASPRQQRDITPGADRDEAIGVACELWSCGNTAAKSADHRSALSPIAIGIGRCNVAPRECQRLSAWLFENRIRN
jgi:hypothetical protein